MTHQYMEIKLKELEKRIEALEQEPKTGHWITTRTFMHDGEYYCDKCKCDAPNNEKWDYCPNCGAKMESDIEKRKPCINYEDGCEEWAGCPCVDYKAESEGKE